MVRLLKECVPGSPYGWLDLFDQVEGPGTKGAGP